MNNRQAKTLLRIRLSLSLFLKFFLHISVYRAGGWEYKPKLRETEVFAISALRILARQVTLFSNRLAHLHSKCQTNETKGKDEDPVGLEWYNAPHVLA